MKKHRKSAKRQQHNAHKPRVASTRQPIGTAHPAVLADGLTGKSRFFKNSQITHKMTVALLSATIAVIGAMAGVANLLPRVAVDPLFTWDGRDPLTTEFVVKNSGYVSLRDVRCSCLFFGANGAHLQSPDQKGSDRYVLGFEHPEALAPRLPTDGQVTTNCKVMSATCDTCKLSEFDIGIVITYRAVLLPLKRRSVFRFRSTVAADRTIHWLRMTMTPDAEQDLARFEDTAHTKVSWDGGVVNAPTPEHRPPPIGK